MRTSLPAATAVEANHFLAFCGGRVVATLHGFADSGKIA